MNTAGKKNGWFKKETEENEDGPQSALRDRLFTVSIASCQRGPAAAAEREESQLKVDTHSIGGDLFDVV